MARIAVRQTDQSINGLLRALPRTRPFYRTLVTALEGGIARGEVPQGYRLPPERDLAKSLRISRWLLHLLLRASRFSG